MALFGVIILRRFFPLARRGDGQPVGGFAVADGLDQPPLDFPPPEEDEPPLSEQGADRGAHPWDAPQ